MVVQVDLEDLFLLDQLVVLVVLLVLALQVHQGGLWYLGPLVVLLLHHDLSRACHVSKLRVNINITKLTLQNVKPAFQYVCFIILSIVGYLDFLVHPAPLFLLVCQVALGSQYLQADQCLLLNHVHHLVPFVQVFQQNL